MMLAARMLVLTALLLAVHSARGLYSAADGVLELTDDSWDAEIKSWPGVAMVEFYAPWCGHCKQLVPEWKKAASILEGVAKVAAVDATAHHNLASSNKVEGYPTIKVFAGDANPTEYSGGRSADAIVAHAMKAVQELVKGRGGGSGGSSSSKEEEKEEEEEDEGGMGYGNSDVVVLTDSNFEDLVTNGKDLWFVEFYAPWCGHCKSLSPAWKALAEAVKGEVKVGALDATAHPETAKKMGVSGYPMLKFFISGEPKEYDRSRSEDDLIAYAQEMASQYGGAGVLVEQLVSQQLWDGSCLGKALCVVALLPHILDSGAAGRQEYLQLLEGVVKKQGRRHFKYLWSEGGAQFEWEEKLQMTFGFPALLVVSNEKKRFAIMRSAFDDQHLNSFLVRVLTGGESTQSLPPVPKLSTTEPWDGQDGVLPEEEPLDYDD